MTDPTLNDNEAVYLRDATGFMYPGRSIGCYHWPKDPAEPLGISACGKTILDDLAPVRPARVEAHRRCGRPGCRQRWARVPVPVVSRER